MSRTRTIGPRNKEKKEKKKKKNKEKKVRFALENTATQDRATRIKEKNNKNEKIKK